MTVKRFELLIVGAGPAGAMAAKTAGEIGITTALLERKSEITRINRSCTEALGVNEEAFGEFFYFDDRTRNLCFPRNGFTIPYQGPYANLCGFHIYTPGGNRVMMGDCAVQKKLGNAGRVGIVIDKGELIRGILEQARDNQVEIFPNSNVWAVRLTEDGVVVSTSAGDDFTGSYLIAADGVNSRIVKYLGLNKGRKFLGTYSVASWDIEGVEPPDPDAMVSVMGLETSISLCRRPEEGLYHVSSGGYDPSLDHEAGLKNFMTEPAFASWFKNAKGVKRSTACVSSIYEPLKTVCIDKRILIAGDAFWRQETSIIGALMPGRKATASVALTVKDRKSGKNWIDEYVEWYQKFYYGPLGEGGRSLGDLKRILSRDDFDYLASLVKEPLPATMKFYSIIRNIGSAFGRMVPTIRKERPHILARLAEVRAKLEDDILEPRRKAGFPNR
jgi:flavin-dependent dehydrogenase